MTAQADNMEIKYAGPNFKISNLQRTVELFLTDEIGGDKGINGNDFASEILYFADRIPNINIRINSGGGLVKDAQSIIDAIRLANESKDSGDVHTINTGIAYSSAGLILQFGKTRKMVDYGIFQMHDPFLQNLEKLSDAEKSLIAKNKDGITSIFQQKSNLSNGRIKTLMSASNGQGTFFSAQESLDYGLIDEIIPTGKVLELENKSADLQHYICNNVKLDFKDKPKKENKLKLKIMHTEIANKLELQPEASDNAIQNAIDVLKVKAGKVDGLKNELEASRLEIDKLKIENKALTVSTREAVINKAIEEGRIQDTSRGAWMAALENDFEGTKGLIESMNIHHVDAEKIIVSDASADSSSFKGKTFLELSNTTEGVKYLDNLEASNPKKFNTLLAAYNNDNQKTL